MISQKITSNGGAEIGEMIPHIVQTACAYKSAITFEVEYKRVNAKSIMGMMSLSLCNDEEIEVEAAGPDEEEAVTAIVDYMSPVA